MMVIMKSRLNLRAATVFLAFISTVGSFVGPAQIARADEGDVTDHDARLDTFQKQTVALDTGTALTWLALMGLGVVGLTGLFKDAKRSHLD